MTFSFDNLMTLAALALLILLRFDARRFGAADFDDEYGLVRILVMDDLDIPVLEVRGFVRP